MQPRSPTTFRDSIYSEIRANHSQNIPLSILTIAARNLPSFKNLYGSTEIKRVIASITTHLREFESENWILFPCGNELVFVLRNTISDSAIQLAERIFDSWNTIPHPFSAFPFHIDLSIFVIDARNCSAQHVFEAIERACGLTYEDQNDIIMLYNINDQLKKHRDEITMIQKIFQKISNDQLEFCYQPVFGRNKKILFFESLLRVRDPNNGYYLPTGDVFTAIKKIGAGLMRKIDGLVASNAYAKLQKFPNLELSINVSPMSLFNKQWLQSFLTLATDNTTNRRLILEVTECTAIGDQEYATQTIQKLHKHNIRVALDDFGMGYTSFHDLRLLDFDIIKIDGSYVNGIAEKPYNQVYLQSVASITHSIGALFIAEYIANEEDAQIVESMPLIHGYQGFYYGMPEPLSIDN
jgi:EAL domain-containing protein (putative c-di-GMP-specific phosphodiesterase class I)/GGDEF domain-containing protein